MMERKRVDEGTEAYALRALRDCGKKNAGRSGEAERRRMMLGGVIGVEAAAIVGFDKPQPLLIERGEGTLVAIEVVENADHHYASSRISSPTGSSAKASALTRSERCTRSLIRGRRPGYGVCAIRSRASSTRSRLTRRRQRLARCG